MFYKKFYFKLLMSLLLVALAVPQLKAETLIAANGSATSQYAPIYGWYYDQKCKSTMIYSSSMLSDMDGGVISVITFHANANITFSGGEITVKLGEVEATTVSSHFTSGLTQVYKGTPATGSKEYVITLDTPYEYNGGNLAVEVELTKAGSNYPRTYFYGEEQSGYVTYCTYGNYGYDDTYTFLPKATFTYEDATTDPTIRVDNNALNFSALVGSSATSTVTVTGKNLTGDITATVDGAGFSVNPGTLGTTGGELTITYAPTAAGTHTGTLTLSSAGAEAVVITLNGTAEAATTSGTVTPTNLTFNSYPGVAATQTITIENTGNQAFTPSFTIAAPFSIEAATEITAGASKDFTVTYTPTAVGTDNGTLAVDINGTTTNVTLTGTANVAPQEVTVGGGNTNNGLRIAPIYGNYTDTRGTVSAVLYSMDLLTSLVGKKINSVKFYPTAATQFSVGSLEVYIGETDNTFINGNNINDVTVTLVKTISLESGLEVIEIPFDELYTYGGKNLVIKTKVATTGSYGNTYYEYANVGGTVVYTSGTNNNENKGYLPKTTFAYEFSETPVITINPATVDAFSTEVGTPVTATVNVTGEHLVGDITTAISGENADCFNATLENGVLTITYNPTAAGNHTATLTLSSLGAQDVTIELTGTATTPGYSVSMSDNSGAHDFGAVLVNNTNVWTLTITNNGLQSVTPTLSGLEVPFSTTYTAATLAAGESVDIEFTFAPTELTNYSNTIMLSFPEANGAIANYTCVLSGKGVDESYDPNSENEVVKLVTVDKRSIYEPNFIDTANGNNTPQQLNCYDMRFKMAQLDDPDKQIKAGDLRPGNNLFEFYAIDDFGTEFRFATINLFAEGQPSSNPSVNAMDAPIKVTPSVEYYTEDGMPVHPDHKHNTTLNYTEKTYNDVNELVDLEGVIEYVNDTWSANTATNSHPDHYKFQIRGVGQFGDVLTELTAEYVKDNRNPDGSLAAPEGWDYGMWVGPNNENDGAGVWQDTYYFYDLYIKKSFFEERGITGPVTVVINTTLSGSGYNADSYKTITVNGVEQIIAKEKFKDYSWTVPLLDSIPEDHTVEQEPMGVIIRSISGGSDFNKTKSIYIYGGGTGVSNVDVVDIYKSSMNVKSYTQKQVDEDTDRSLVAMNAGAQTDVNVLAYGDPAVTGYDLYLNTSASTYGMTKVSTATHETDGSYTVSSQSESSYNGNYEYDRDESLGNIDGMWLNMYKAYAETYYLPVTVANGVGDDGVVRSNGNTYGSAMQQVEDNGSVNFSSSKCWKSEYTWTKNGVTYAVYNPEVDLTSELPAATGYQLYKYRLWVDYDDNDPAWDFDDNLQLTNKMDRPLYTGTETHIGGQGTEQNPRGGDWAFVASNDWNKVKLVARFYYKKTSASNAARRARPTDSDRLYYVVENQVEIPMNQIVTGVNDVNDVKPVAGVKYYNLAGVESNEPFDGVNIVVTRYTDGSMSTSKVIK